MKKILLIATGGTIASLPSDDGLVPAITGADIVRMVPALEKECEISCQEIMSLDSSNIEPKHWQKMAKTIEENYEKFDGFVITHGTDTMAYTSSALSVMLKNLGKPIAITGAQLPISVEGSDAPKNVLSAFSVALSDVPGVMLVFGDYVIKGNCARKMCTENFNGFSSVNKEPLGLIDAGGIHWNKAEVTEAKKVSGSLKVATKLEEKVAVIKIIPGSSPEVLEYYVEKGYKGLILESFGAGGVPNDENNWLPELEKTIKAGVKVVCATQCIYDGVDLDKYPIGSLAEKIGAQSAGLDTLETTITKLMWSLAN